MVVLEPSGIVIAVIPGLNAPAPEVVVSNLPAELPEDSETEIAPEFIGLL